MRRFILSRIKSRKNICKGQKA